MGEAKRKREAREEAYGWGRKFNPAPRCPACGSARVIRQTAAQQPALIREQFACDLGLCLDCSALWEAFPADGYVEDPVCAEPCDNCAFRPGSPEQADKEGWKKLIESLKPDAEQFFRGRFYCHKGVPVDMTKGPGNFLFPQKPILVDGDVLLRPSTGEAVTTEDTAKMRTCSGFLRMFWNRLAKLESTP